MNGDNYLFYSALASALPVLLFVGIIYWADHYEKEPLWLLSAAFLWGAIPAALLAMFFNGIFSLPFYLLFPEWWAELASSGFIAPVVEEIAKGIALFLIIFVQRNELDSPLDGIVYGATVGMGFAMVENYLYYVSYFKYFGVEGWNNLVLFRGLVFGLNHALYTAMTGLGIAISRSSKNGVVRLFAPFMGLALAMTLHATHNLAMSGGNNVFFMMGIVFDWGGLSMTFLIVALALYQERRWMRYYLKEEIDLGYMTADEYRTVQSARLRFLHRLRILFTVGPRAFLASGKRFRRFSELAYSKRRYDRLGDENSMRNVVSLRGKIVASEAEKAGPTI